jgi:hypothetical protein
MHPASLSARWPRLVPGVPTWPLGCDDSRLVGLKLIFLVVSRTVSLLRLSRRESWWKDAEVLMLRHQLSVALREQPRAHSRLTWPDRAWLALLAGTLPIDRLAAMRLIVTPGTVLRWHRDIVRRRWARRSRHGRWRPGSTRCRAGTGRGWPEFLRSQAQGILALDFFTADLLNGTKIYVLAVIELGTRRLLMDLDDAGTRVKFMLHDRDASFTLASGAVFQAASVRVIRSAVQAPRMNSINRGPTPEGSVHANREPCSSGGCVRLKSSQVANPSGGGGTTYPSTSHQKRATRSGSAQSKVTWNCLTDVIGPPQRTQHLRPRSTEGTPRVPRYIAGIFAR